MFCWHIWGKWSDPYGCMFARASSDTPYWHVCQLRTCGKCGKAEVRKLPKIRSIAELKKEH